MNSSHPLPQEYLDLAALRAAAKPIRGKQPEDFGYDFRQWVSPYTKGAHSCGGYALVLQDWLSTDALKGEFDPEIQAHGRVLSLRTNVRLEKLLAQVLGVSLRDVYATNAFPFIKPGKKDAPLGLGEVCQTVRTYAVEELKIARPSVVLALGGLAYLALQRAGVSCIHLPHPAARIGGLVDHERAWIRGLSEGPYKADGCRDVAWRPPDYFISNDAINPEHIPGPAADAEALMRFALTFRGYEHFGSFEACAEIANARRHTTLSDVRACLYFEQRRWHHFGESPDSEALAYWLEMVAKIRAMVASRDAT